MSRARSRPESRDAPRWFAWLALAIGALATAGLLLVVWAFNHEVVLDVALSPLHVPLYGAMAAAATLTAVLAIRHRPPLRRPWMAMPDGYESLAAGVIVFMAGLAVDLGWREGVGVAPGIEQGLAPGRLLAAAGVALVAIAPLRAAFRTGIGAIGVVPAALSGAFSLAAVGWIGGFNPVMTPWLAVDPSLPRGLAELWVMDADGSHQTRLLEPPPDVGFGYASWSPDGDEIAYTAFGLDANGDSTRSQVRAVSADGSGDRLLVDSAEWLWIPRLSADGASVLYTQEAPGGPFTGAGPVGPGAAAGPQGPLSIPLPEADLWRAATPDGGAPERLTDAGGDDRAPVPSPDGRLILFDSTRDGNTELYVIDADGSNPRRITDDPGEDWGGSWSPDGSQIAFNSSRTGVMEIYVMDADGGNVRQLTHDNGFNTAPTWSPDGSRLAFSDRRMDGQARVVSINLEGGDRRDLSRRFGTDDQVWTGGWGPDGRIAFTRTPAAPAEVSGLVRIDLAVAGALLSAGLLAVLVVTVARLGAPFGTLTLAAGIAIALLAAAAEGWRFLPVGVVAGLTGDLVAWRRASSRRLPLAGAASAAAFVLANGIAALLTTGLEWTPTLLIGAALAAGGVGLGVGLFGRWQAAERSVASP